MDGERVGSVVAWKKTLPTPVESLIPQINCPGNVVDGTVDPATVQKLGAASAANPWLQIRSRENAGVSAKLLHA